MPGRRVPCGPQLLRVWSSNACAVGSAVLESGLGLLLLSRSWRLLWTFRALFHAGRKYQVAPRARLTCESCGPQFDHHLLGLTKFLVPLFLCPPHFCALLGAEAGVSAVGSALRVADPFRDCSHVSAKLFPQFA